MLPLYLSRSPARVVGCVCNSDKEVSFDFSLVFLRHNRSFGPYIPVLFLTMQNANDSLSFAFEISHSPLLAFDSRSGKRRTSAA